MNWGGQTSKKIVEKLYKTIHTLIYIRIRTVWFEIGMVYDHVRSRHRLVNQSFSWTNKTCLNIFLLPGIIAPTWVICRCCKVFIVQQTYTIVWLVGFSWWLQKRKRTHTKSKRKTFTTELNDESGNTFGKLGWIIPM